MSNTKALGPHLTTVGIYDLFRTEDGTAFVLCGTGYVVGTFPTARAATDHAVSLIAATHKASK